MGVKAASDRINSIPARKKGVSEEEGIRVKKYLRGEAADLEVLLDKKLKGQLAFREKLYAKSAQAVAKAEKWLMPCGGGYRETWRIKQEAIAAAVDILTMRKQYDIVLPDLGPYTLNFTLTGQYMIAAGRKGHLALIDMQNMDLIREFQVRETVHDAVFLQNQSRFAAAQEKYYRLPFLHISKEYEY